MEEQYVTFETAELAYLKGLPIFLNSGNDLSCYEIKNKNFIFYHVHIDFPSKEEFVYAPTQSLLQKWLREKHGIDIHLGRNGIRDDWNLDGVRKFGYPFTPSDHRFKTSFKTYEDALEVGLKESLKLI